MNKFECKSSRPQIAVGLELKKKKKYLPLQIHCTHRMQHFVLNGPRPRRFREMLSERMLKPDYSYYCVVDLECTCDETNTKPHEIIELPAIFVNAKTMQVRPRARAHRFWRPLYTLHSSQ